MIKTQEELAELHEAFSHFLAKRKPIDAVGDEVSNSLDWICSAWGILYSNISLDHTIIDYYYEDCPFCHKHPCSCKPRMDRVSQLVDSSRILRIEEQIGELSSLLGARDPEMDELRKSLAAARETQSEPIARQAVANTKQKLESIADGLSRTNEAGKKDQFHHRLGIECHKDAALLRGVTFLWCRLLGAPGRARGPGR